MGLEEGDADVMEYYPQELWEVRSYEISSACSCALALCWGARWRW